MIFLGFIAIIEIKIVIIANSTNKNDSVITFLNTNLERNQAVAAHNLKLSHFFYQTSSSYSLRTASCRAYYPICTKKFRLLPGRGLTVNVISSSLSSLLIRDETRLSFHCGLSPSDKDLVLARATIQAFIIMEKACLRLLRMCKDTWSVR